MAEDTATTILEITSNKTAEETLKLPLFVKTVDGLAQIERL